MRLLSITFVCLLLAPLCTPKNTFENQIDLNIKVTNLKKDKGFILVAVFDQESKFLSDFSLAKRKKVVGKADEFTFKNLPSGTYAISVFQDVNNNSKLDTNFLGIPKEPYGFSNNPSTLFGPPSFKKASFLLHSETKTVTIKL